MTVGTLGDTVQAEGQSVEEVAGSVAGQTGCLCDSLIAGGGVGAEVSTELRGERLCVELGTSEGALASSNAQHHRERRGR